MQDKPYVLKINYLELYNHSKEEKGMKKEEVKNNPIVKFARFLGGHTVGKCCIWFNQPVVPSQLQNEANFKHEQKKENR